jgi:hypothetical protein
MKEKTIESAINLLIFIAIGVFIANLLILLN